MNPVKIVQTSASQDAIYEHILPEELFEGLPETLVKEQHKMLLKEKLRTLLKKVATNVPVWMAPRVFGGNVVTAEDETYI